MSGAMRKMGVYLGLFEDSEGEFAELDRGQQERGQVEHTQAVTRIDRRQAAPARAVAPVAPVASVAPTAPAVAPLSRITTLHPRTYNDARVVGENFRDGVPVIMNLSDMTDGDAKRLVDFAAGLVFAAHGTIERVTSKVFLLSPPNVDVDAEDKQRIVEGGFFNQS